MISRQLGRILMLIGGSRPVGAWLRPPPGRFGGSERSTQRIQSRLRPCYRAPLAPAFPPRIGFTSQPGSADVKSGSRPHFFRVVLAEEDRFFWGPVNSFSKWRASGTRGSGFKTIHSYAGGMKTQTSFNRLILRAVLRRASGTWGSGFRNHSLIRKSFTPIGG